MSESEFDPVTRSFIDKALQTCRWNFAASSHPRQVQRFVDEAIASIHDARIKDYIPIFVNRFARERLRALAQVEGSIVKDVPEVLFVCVHNAGRNADCVHNAVRWPPACWPSMRTVRCMSAQQAARQPMQSTRLQCKPWRMGAEPAVVAVMTTGILTHINRRRKHADAILTIVNMALIPRLRGV